MQGRPALTASPATLRRALTLLRFPAGIPAELYLQYKYLLPARKSESERERERERCSSILLVRAGYLWGDGTRGERGDQARAS